MSLMERLYRGLGRQNIVGEVSKKDAMEKLQETEYVEYQKIQSLKNCFMI